MADYRDQINQTIKQVLDNFKLIRASMDQAEDVLEGVNTGLRDRVDDIASGWNSEKMDTDEGLANLPPEQKQQQMVQEVRNAIAKLQGIQGMGSVVAALQALVGDQGGQGSITAGIKKAELNPTTMGEEYSKELLISQAALLMDRMMSGWPDLVVDDITNTGTRAYEYRNGKVHTGEIGWHLTVGSQMMGVGRQVKIVFPIKNGFLQVPETAQTPLGEEISLEPTAFSNWVRLGIKK